MYVNANSIYSRELLLVKDSQNRRDDLREGADHFPGIVLEWNSKEAHWRRPGKDFQVLQLGSCR